MNRSRWLWAWMAIFMVSFGLHAAPFVPATKKDPDEIRCLAKIKRVGVRVGDVPSELANALDRDRVAKLVRQRLLAEDFVITDDSESPQLVLNFKILADKAWPDVIGVVLLLDVEQQVEVVRLGERMQLPTTTVVSRAFSTQGQLAKVIEKRCLNATGQFINLTRRMEE